MENEAEKSDTEYRIITIADAIEKIPEEKIDAFLLDLGNMMKTHKRIEQCLSQLARTTLTADLAEGFTWIDDGKRDQRITVH